MLQGWVRGQEDVSRGLAKDAVWPQQEEEHRQVEKFVGTACGAGVRLRRGGSRVLDKIRFCSGAGRASME